MTTQTPKFTPMSFDYVLAAEFSQLERVGFRQKRGSP
jgi:hypothetical protein